MYDNLRLVTTPTQMLYHVDQGKVVIAAKNYNAFIAFRLEGDDYVLLAKFKYGDGSKFILNDRLGAAELFEMMVECGIRFVALPGNAIIERTLTPQDEAAD